MSGERILIVEDDVAIATGLELNLQAEGYTTAIARDGDEGVRRFREAPPDLVLLDVMLPEVNGLEVLSSIRRVDAEVPVLLLTARDAQQDKLSGLALGADDYITKPFALPELLARINAALRRPRLKLGPAPGVIVVGDIHIDTGARRVTRKGEPIEMTSREFELLVYLCRSRDRVLTREQILRAVWGDDYEGTERTVDNFIVRLRNKIEANPDDPQLIRTVRGVGYSFVPPGPNGERKPSEQ